MCFQANHWGTAVSLKKIFSYSTNTSEQECVLEPTLFSMMFSAPCFCRQWLRQYSKQISLRWNST